MENINLNNFEVFALNTLFCIESISLIRDKYKQMKHLGLKYKYVDDAISVFHRVSNENHDLCVEFIKKIIIKIEENKQMCLDEFNLNTNYTLEERKKIDDIIFIMDNLKSKLEKISPLDFIIEIQDKDKDKDKDKNEEDEQYEQDEDQEDEEKECEIGPYDYLLESDKYDRSMISYDYDGYNGYDN